MSGRDNDSILGLTGIALLAGLLVFVGGLSTPATAQTDVDQLGVGSFLVASRSLVDPNFDQTVVLLLDYSENGALGVIINRPTRVKLSEMVGDLEAAQERPETVFVGGPVAHWQLVVLVRSKRDLEGAEKVFEDIHFTASRVVLEQVLEDKQEFRPYAGYAGWGAGQLEDEIDRGSWHVLPGEPDMVFDAAPRELWRELIARGEALWASL